MTPRYQMPGVKGYDPDEDELGPIELIDECVVCHQVFDMRDPMQALKHQHGRPIIFTVNGKPV